MEFKAKFGNVSHTDEIERVPVKVLHQDMQLEQAVKIMAFGELGCEILIDPLDADDIEGQTKLIDGSIKLVGMAEVSKSFTWDKTSIGFSLAFDLGALSQCGNPSLFALAKKHGRIKFIPPGKFQVPKNNGK